MYDKFSKYQKKWRNPRGNQISLSSDFLFWTVGRKEETIRLGPLGIPAYARVWVSQDHPSSSSLIKAVFVSRTLLLPQKHFHCQQTPNHNDLSVIKLCHFLFFVIMKIIFPHLWYSFQVAEPESVVPCNFLLLSVPFNLSKIIKRLKKYSLVSCNSTHFELPTCDFCDLNFF